MFIKIHVEKNKFRIIGNILRPKGSDLSKFKDKLLDILEFIKRDKVLSTASELQLLGDFNVNLLNHSIHSGTSIFLDSLLSKGLLPLITLPTRITQNSSTLINKQKINHHSVDIKTPTEITAKERKLVTFQVSPLDVSIPEIKIKATFWGEG